MEKELLTKGRIRADVKQFNHQHIKHLCKDLLFGFFFYWILRFILYCILTPFNISQHVHQVITIIYTIAYCITLVVALIPELSISKSILKHPERKLVITDDYVVEKLDIIYGQAFGSRTNTLVFAISGKYAIPYDKSIYYKWSKLYAMNGETLYRFTDLKDEFYVISINKKPVLAYNKKCFELEE